MKKRWSLLVWLVVFAMIVGISAGCSGAKTKEPEKLKVALLVPGSITDGGWSESAYKGLKKVESDFGAEVSYMQIKSPSDVVEGFRDYAQKGYKIVFGHSYDYQDAAKRVGPDFKNTIFITSGGTTVMDNVSPIYTEFEQATYLMGVVAAKMTKTGTVGMIGSQDMPAISKTLISFEQGVKDTDSKVKVLKTYIGSQDDVGKAKEATITMINSGADIFWVSANAAGQGALQAVRENAKKGVKIFGSYSRWSDKDPDVVIADGVIDFSNAFSVIVKQVKDGTWKSGTIRVGTKDNVVQFLWNAKMTIPQPAKDAYDKALKDIQDGKIKINIGAY
ncbi:MAG TPA: BMP family protein [Bacillota bacterium]